jgi:hypothetical protein
MSRECAGCGAAAHASGRDTLSARNMPSRFRLPEPVVVQVALHCAVQPRPDCRDRVVTPFASGAGEWPLRELLGRLQAEHADVSGQVAAHAATLGEGVATDDSATMAFGASAIEPSVGNAATGTRI